MSTDRPARHSRKRSFHLGREAMLPGTYDMAVGQNYCSQLRDLHHWHLRTILGGEV